MSVRAGGATEKLLPFHLLPGGNAQHACERVIWKSEVPPNHVEQKSGANALGIGAST